MLYYLAAEVQNSIPSSYSSLPSITIVKRRWCERLLEVRSSAIFYLFRQNIERSFYLFRLRIDKMTARSTYTCVPTILSLCTSRDGEPPCHEIGMLLRSPVAGGEQAFHIVVGRRFPSLGSLLLLRQYPGGQRGSPGISDNAVCP